MDALMLGLLLAGSDQGRTARVAKENSDEMENLSRQIESAIQQSPLTH